MPVKLLLHNCRLGFSSKVNIMWRMATQCQGHPANSATGCRFVEANHAPYGVLKCTVSWSSKVEKKNPLAQINFSTNCWVEKIAKTLALCLEKELPSLISEDQTELVKNRQLSANMRRLLNVLYDPTPPKDTEVLISLDAEKAFDRVEWLSFLHFEILWEGWTESFTICRWHANIDDWPWSKSAKDAGAVK